MSNGNPPPQVDFTLAKQIGTSIHDTLLSMYSEFATPGWLAEFLASAAGGLIFCFAFLILIAVQMVMALGTWAAVSILEIITNARENNADDFNQVIAASLSELLGTEIDAGSLPGGQGPGGIGDRMDAIGGAVHNLLISEFGGLQPVDPATGFENAKKFSGFAINFATSSAFISVLTEACSLGYLKEFRELGVETAGALGLGRLQRLAMQPLIQTLIQKPYQRYLNQATRPTVLSEGQLVKALHSGQMDQGTVVQNMQYLGYPDDLIDFVLTDLEAKIGMADLELLLLNGDIEESDVEEDLRLKGMNANQVPLQMKATQLAAVKGQQNGLLAWAEEAYVAGYITHDQWNTVLEDLMLSDLEESAIRQRVGWRQESPRKTVTFAEVKAAVVDAVVDFSYLDAWMAREGYDPDAKMILSFEVFKALDTAEKKASYAKYKAQQLQAKGKPVPPWITDAETVQ